MLCFSRVPLLPLTLALLLTGACKGGGKPEVISRDGGPRSDASADGGGDGGGDAFVPPPPPECDPEENEFCMEGGGAIGCDEEVFDLEPKGVQVMFMIDGSSSMENHWQLVSDALVTAVIANPDVAFGMHLFYASNDFGGFLEDGNICGEDENILLDVDIDNGQNLFDTMGPRPPGTGNRFLDTSPVVQALNYYVENDTKLRNPDTTNYVVMISDANDNCFGTFLASKNDKNAAFAKIAVELLKRNIRVIPVGFDSGTGMGIPGYEIQTNVPALETLTEYGGAGLTEVLSADDPEQLQTILSAIGQKVTPCRFAIPATLDPSQNVNGFELNFFLNGNPVERDRSGQSNWNFVDGNTSEVEFRGDACEAIRAGKKLEVRRGCDNEKVCSSSAARLQTRTRVVQFALDNSLSMGIPDLTCTPFVDCCIPYVDDDCLVPWGEAVSAISNALVLPANDDAEVGLQYFPQYGTRPEDVANYCSVRDTPEIPPAAGTEIAIIKNLLANLPVASTPLVQVMEATAANPGRLAEPETKGAVILVSDGQHAQSCGNIEPTEAAERLAAAAMTLLEEHDTLVYAIKFGYSEDPNVNAQLEAIAQAGGTDMFRVAEDGESLTAVLSEITDELASCVIDIDLDADDADPEKLNIYLDAELIPQDPNLLEGWYWVDEDTKDAVEIYGESCRNLKQTRLSNLVVEFGCEVVKVPLI